MDVKTVRNWRTLIAVALVVPNLAAYKLLASTVEVGSCVKGLKQYTTIQAAVDGSAAGTVIDVCPATYPEQVVIGKQLTLVGVKANQALNPTVVSPSGGVVQNATDLATGAGIAAQVLVQTATGVDITGITIDGANNQAPCDVDLVGIYYQNASGTVNYGMTRNQTLGNGCQSGEGVFAQSGYGFNGASKVTISNSSIYSYQKNGITADGNTLTVIINGNSVAGQGPTSTIAQNGMQISDGTVAKISSNTVEGDVYTGSSSSATAILIFAASGSTLTGNTISNSQGIVLYSDPTYGAADNTTLNSNHVFNTNLFDGVDVCSNKNTLTLNRILSSGQGGIHLDDSCVGPGNVRTGKNNTVTHNVITDACAGIMYVSKVNKFSPNTIHDVANVILKSNICSQSGSAPRTKSSRAISPRL